MSGSHETLQLDDIKETTLKALDKLTKGELFMSTGLEEHDIFRLVTLRDSEKGKKTNQTKQFLRFRNFLLNATFEDNSILPAKNEKKTKSFVRNSIIAHQSYIIDVIKDYMVRKNYIQKDGNNDSVGSMRSNQRTEIESTSSAYESDEEEDDSDQDSASHSDVESDSDMSSDLGVYGERYNHDESDEEELDFSNNPLLIVAKERFEVEKNKLLNKIPHNVKKDFRQIGFSRWGKQMLPIIEVGPFDVEPGHVRDQWMTMFKNSIKSKKSPSRLIMWYGTIWENRTEAYSFVSKQKITSFSSGQAKGYDKLPKALHKKILDGKDLTEREKFHIQGLDQMKKDFELPPNQRIQWMSRFVENYDAYYLLEDEEAISHQSPNKTETKPTSVNMTKKKLQPKQELSKSKKKKGQESNAKVKTATNLNTRKTMKAGQKPDQTISENDIEDELTKFRDGFLNVTQTKSENSRRDSAKRKKCVDEEGNNFNHKKFKQILNPMNSNKAQNTWDNKGIQSRALKRMVTKTKEEEIQKYQFSEEAFLHSKKFLCSNAINKGVWNDVVSELSEKFEQIHGQSTSLSVTILDLSANYLFMLDHFLNDNQSNHDFGKMQQIQRFLDIKSVSSMHSDLNNKQQRGITYYAYEPDNSLLPIYKKKLSSMGFQEFASLSSKPLSNKISSVTPVTPGTPGTPTSTAPTIEEINSTEKAKTESIDKEDCIYSCQHGEKHITVHLIMSDFRVGYYKASNLIEVRGRSPDLIVGCCFADLFPSPRELMSSINEITSTNTENQRNSSTMLYFPITFAGTTLLHPPQPFATSEDSVNTMMIPSDTFALRSYSHILEKYYQHNLDHTSIIRAAENFGMSLVSSGPSDWNIDPKEHSYLWDTMRFFFKSVIDNNIKEWNMKGWHDRVLRTRPSIVAKNVDLLFRLDSSQKMGVINEVSRSNALHEHRSVNEMEEIEFTEPYKVHSVKKSLGNSKQALGPNEIKVQSICSLISSGTELKIFRGTFDNTEPLDVNIKGMSDTAMAYPLSYGYSLVGRIIGCGSPKNKHLLGEHVFTFSPHSSHLICDLSSVHIVPKGIAPEDAMFLPSVETALSIVHDAHIRMGERVGVFGQGLIGLLVTSILSLNKHEMKTDINGMLYGTVTVFDTILDRLAASSAVGASEALLPSSAMDAGPFDVTIEVSGNGRALQTAIDATRAHGRIIIGSWYGSTDVNLKLGMEFHRSHKTLLATQVSEIPPGLRGLWNKERRFNLSWELVRLLRPSKHLVTRWEELGNAQQAYDALDKGKEISVAFRYNTK